MILTVAAGAWIYAALYGSLNQGIGVTHAAGDGHGSHAGHGAAPDAMHDNMTTASGSHGGLSSTALVWIGLTVLLAAQVWDLRRVRACRHPAATAPAPATSAPTTTE